MSLTRAQTIFIFATIVFFGVVTGMIFVKIEETRERNAVLEQKLRAAQEELDKARRDLRNRERYLDLLLKDKDFFERVVRDRLGQVPLGDTIISLPPKDSKQPSKTNEQ